MDELNRLSIAIHIVKDKEVETEDEIKQRQDLRQQIMDVKYPLIVGNVDKLNSQMGLLERNMCSRNTLACEEDKHMENQRNRQTTETMTDNRISYASISPLSNGLPKAVDKNSPKRTSAPRFIETHQCPEFDGKDPNPLPFNISPKKMLGKALKALCFPGRLPSRPTFNKLLYSLPCQDILKDIFWHRFLSHVKSNMSVQKKLFHRVAKNYVTLMQVARQTYFTDSFFQELPFLLPPAIYASFLHCFGDSSHQFDSAFKETTIQLVWLWMTGINPSPGIWKKWNCKLLEPDDIILSESKLGSKTAKNWHPQESEDESDLPRQQRRKKPSTSREAVQQLAVADETLRSTASFLPKYLTRKDNFGRDDGLNVVQNFSNLEKKITTNEILVRTTFNLNGSCPLVQHFLRAQNAELHAGTVTRVQRTQIKSMQPVMKCEKSAQGHRPCIRLADTCAKN